MSTVAIMAGGRSERMRLTTGHTHKALVCVLGIPMLERNLLALVSQGFSDIIVVFNSQEHAIREYILERGIKLARAHSARVRCYEEEVPLGTIGAAGMLLCNSEPLLVVNVDNLTTLDLRGFRDHHLDTNATLSIATHYHHFQIPFGEVIVQEGLITEYREKPSFSVHLSSGTYILSSRARASISKGTRTDIPELVCRLRNHGERIVSFEHTAPWIDVNDGVSLRAAELLIKKNSEQFNTLLTPNPVRVSTSTEMLP